MLVREAMTPRPVTVRPDSSVKAALALLDRHSVTMLPVTSAQGVLVGILSEADVIRDRVGPDARATMMPPDEARTDFVLDNVSEVMNHRSVTVREDTDLADAAELMTSTSVKSLRVVDDHFRVVGVLSRRDIVHLLARSDADVEREIDDLYRRLGVTWLVDVSDGLVTVTGPVDEKDRALAVSAASTVAGVVHVRVA